MRRGGWNLGACIAGFLAFGSVLGAASVEEPGRPEGKLDEIKDVYLSLRDAPYSSCGWGTARDNTSVTGTELRIGSQAFDRGIGTHAPAEIAVRLGGRYHWLTLYAGRKPLPVPITGDGAASSPGRPEAGASPARRPVGAGGPASQSRRLAGGSPFPSTPSLPPP